MWKIIIADDEPKMVSGIRDILRMECPEVEVVATAMNGKDALELIQVIDIDIALIDICMPKLNGIELIKAIREYDMELKIIIITGYNEFDYAREALRLNVNNYVLKPIVISELKSAIYDAILDIKNERDKENLIKLATLIVKEDNVTNQDVFIYNWVEKELSDEEKIRRIKGKLECRPVVREAREYINQHYKDSNMDLGIVSSAIGINSAYLSRLMKQELGLSFKDYLTNLRINRAIELIIDGELSISEISDKVGYSSQHYFSVAFKNVMGVSPTEYRKSII